MTETLIINGKVADIDSETNIVVNIKNNYFQDVSKINAANTNTIKLPKTRRNREIFEDADLIAAESVFPYYYQEVDLYRDGIEVVSGGSLYLLQTTEKQYEVTIIFGVDAVLKLLSETEDTLQDLNDSATIYYEPQSLYAIPLWSEYARDNYFYIDGDFSKRLENEDEHDVEVQRGWLSKGVMPVASVVWLLRLIEQKYGFAMTWEGDTFSLIYKLAVPLITHKGDEKTQPADGVTITGGNLNKATMSLLTHNVFSPSSTSTQLYVTSQKKLTIRFAIVKEGVSSSVVELYRVMPFRVVVKSRSDNSEVSSENVNLLVTKLEGNVYRVSCNQSVEVTLKASEYLSLEGGTMLWTYFAPLSGTTFSVSVAGEDVQRGGRMPVVRNLPKIKILDFVKSLLAISGAYLYSDTRTAVAYNSILWNIDRAVDWSDKLLSVSREGMPENMTYKVGDYAQRNLLEWKKADDIEEGRYNGAIVVNNATLDKEKTMYTMPFAACNTINGRANIPIFELENLKELVSGEESVPRYGFNTTEGRLIYCAPVYNSDRSATLVGATFPSFMDMNNVVAEKYTMLQLILNNAVVIKDAFRLSDLDVQKIEWDKPVYLSQYGAYFLVYEVRQKKNEICDVTLVKINVIRRR